MATEDRDTGGYSIQALKKSFGELEVLKDISCSFPSGRTTVVLGPSGCGKTSLLRLISGLSVADSGRIQGFADARFSYAFQEPRLLPWRSVRANLAISLAAVLPEKDARERIDHFLDIVGLAAFADSLPGSLSGGMRQRTSLARAFAYPSDVLLMDEPFQAVDLKMKIELMDAFRVLMSDERRTVICVTHDISEALYLGDRIIVLSARPARVAAVIDPPETSRSFGDPALMETEERLYKLVLGA